MIYVISIYGQAGVFEALPKDRQDEVMSGHGALQTALKARGEFVTMKLMPPTSAVMVEPARAEGQPPLITDGPFSETKEVFGGFFIIEAESYNHAAELCQQIVTRCINDSSFELINKSAHQLFAVLRPALFDPFSGTFSSRSTALLIYRPDRYLSGGHFGYPIF